MPDSGGCFILVSQSVGKGSYARLVQSGDAISQSCVARLFTNTGKGAGYVRPAKSVIESEGIAVLC